MKRRSFLRGTGVFLTAWAASGSINRYAQVLAQSTPRKLALLIGINQYRNANLNGCITDVELQKELLIHRFGFQSSDIVTLTNQNATRSQIESVFTQHLVEQAKPDDVVVLHFSGYGSLQKLGATIDDVQPVLISADDSSDNVISQDTLFLLLRSLATDQVTTVLDVGYTYPGYSLQGNLRLRSAPADISKRLRPIETATQLSDDERTVQDALLAKLQIDRAQVRAKWRSGQMPGVVLTAATAQQFATESAFSGFSAGLFTYALTQQLWQATPQTTLRIGLRHASELIAQRVDGHQQPTLSGQKSAARSLKPYQTDLMQPPAEGVVTGVEDTGKVAQLWLGGLPPQVLEQYSANSLFTIAAEDFEPHSLLQIVERSGLVAKARWVVTDATENQSILPGQLVQEAVRILPKNLGLSVAIDTHLQRIERVDAVSAFASVPRVTATIAGEQAADYLFAKVQETTQVATIDPDAIAIPPARYGLFSPGREAIPNTAGESGEAIKLAVRRLAPQLQTRLGAKLLSMTVNEESSQLGVRATLTPLAPDASTRAMSVDSRLSTIPVGSRMQYRIENSSDREIYFLILGLDSTGAGFAWAQAGLIEPMNSVLNTTGIAPTAEWILQGASGLAQTYVICSRAPFRQVQPLLGSPAATPLKPINNFLEIAQAVLQDLHQASERAAQWTNTSDVFALDVNAWTTFRFVYQVV